MGWHPHEQTEEDEKLRLNRQASSRSQLGDVASAMDCLEDEEEVNPKDFLTLTEYVRKKGMPDLQQRLGEWLDGHPVVIKHGKSMKIPPFIFSHYILYYRNPSPFTEDCPIATLNKPEGTSFCALKVLLWNLDPGVPFSFECQPPGVIFFAPLSLAGSAL